MRAARNVAEKSQNLLMRPLESIAHWCTIHIAARGWRTYHNIKYVGCEHSTRLWGAHALAPITAYRRAWLFKARWLRRRSNIGQLRNMAVDWQTLLTVLAFAALSIFVQSSSATHDRSDPFNNRILVSFLTLYIASYYFFCFQYLLWAGSVISSSDRRKNGLLQSRLQHQLWMVGMEKMWSY